LADWEKPSGRDRVLHVWRPLAPRDPAPVKAALVPALFKDASGQVREASAQAAGKLGMKEAGPALAELAAPGQPSGLRVEAMRALAALGDVRLQALLGPAAADRDPAVKKEAARLLKSAGGPEAEARLAAMALEGPVPVRQAAVAGLAGMKGAEAAKALAKLADDLASGALPPGLRLDVLEAASKRPDLADRVKRYEASKSKEDPLAAWSESLEGGDAEAGRKLFFEKAETSCTKCHAALGKGGIVGPDLSKLGGQKPREYLLEAIVAPNRQIAEGYGQTILLMADESVETGRVEKEDAQAVHLVLADGNRKRVAKDSIKARKAGLSAMPEDLLKALSKREIRDLVEFLAGLK
jgi:quinoprotein glucose dehydrogenase